MLHLPILRAGEPYRSLETTVLRHVSTGEPVVRVSQANRGLIVNDLLAAADHRRAMERHSAADLLAVCARAAKLFAEADLLVDPIDGVTQSPESYWSHLSATTGMPLALCRANMEKIRHVLAEMETVLGGLTRGLDLSVLDTGWTRQGGQTICYIGEAQSLGVVLPSNSPGVHSLWLPSIPLKVPLALKPGSQEPWTPMRAAQALIAAGCPPEAFGFYPTDYSGSAEILLRCDRSMLFGDESTVRPWKADPRVQIHGPGWSKLLWGADSVGDWERHVELMVTSIAENGGRSCINASGVWLPANGREVAVVLAERLAAIEPLPLDDPEARIAAFSNPGVAHSISKLIDRQLELPGAEDLTAPLRSGDRVVEVGGCTFLRPTLIWCEDPAHPLAASEFLFPFAAVVQVPQNEMLRRIGPTLVATALTEDETFKAELMRERNIDRLNLGPIPTCRLSWDQPHEGNLFEHLYRQRAFQGASVG
jgi:acyl-CoA reductase-like NAD-dependent aldehyde dehydrogenase